MSHLDDNDVLALVSGKLGPERLRELEAHLDGCDACRQLAAASAHAPDSAGEGKPKGAQQLGRYSVLNPVGAGAMGIVYAAYDPVLDRRVALKLLHAAGGEAEKLRARLLREAQAMARLSHPNVIAVHDVGTVHDQVFVAMEFVEGCTLSQWIARKHPWREVLRVFVLAGRGLAAAHAAGLVHRDFKPDNVLIGDDGRVRVTDFGLARSEERAPFDWSAAASLPSLSGTLSESGVLVGSPAYMAPEQMRGEAVDARADEFSFSVALYEALYGERPFIGKDLRELRAAIEAGNVRPEPGGARVPGWVRRVLLRGISSKPAERFPSLEALLDALENDPAASRRHAIVGIAIICFLIGVVALVRWQSGRGERGCRGAEEKVRAVLTPSLRQSAQLAFAATKLPYADAAWLLAQKALDRYAQSWAALRTDACEATEVRKEQSPELLDLRMSCLDDRLRELSATAALFATADAAIVAKSADLASSLPPLAACSDARALREPGAPTEAQRARVEALRDELAKAHALHRAGKAKEALPLDRDVVESAKKIGFAPLEAKATLELALDLNQSGDAPAAQKMFPDAAAAGLRARVDSVIAAGWTEALLTDVTLTKLDEADVAAVQAKAAVSRLGDDPEAQAALATALASYSRRRDRMDLAVPYAQQAVDILEKAHGEPHAFISALAELNLALETQSKMIPALAAQERAWKLAVEQYGSEHPLTGEMEGEYGSLLCTMNRNAEGVPHLEHALVVLQGALGPNHPAVADILTSLGDNSIRHDPKKAQDYARRALRIQERGPMTSAVPYGHSLLGLALEAGGEFEAARKEFETSIAIERKIAGEDEDLETALSQSNLGELLLQEGKLKAARVQLELAAAAQRKGFGPGSSQEGETLESLAHVAYEEKNLAEAKQLTVRAIAIEEKALPGSPQISERQLFLMRIEQDQGAVKETLAPLEAMVALPAAKPPDDDEFDRDEAKFLLARALWQTRTDRPRARKLAEEAHAHLVARGAPSRKDADEAARWLNSAK